jgi:hypothetical protein
VQSFRKEGKFTIEHILPEFAVYILKMSDGGTLLRQCNVVAFFGQEIRMDYSNTVNGSFGEVVAPVSFLQLLCLIFSLS